MAKSVEENRSKLKKSTGNKFSTEHIRKAPVGAQIKRVIDFLFETRQAFTPEQISKACDVDVNANKAVCDGLRNNPKVTYDGKRFSYKSKHDLRDKDQLLDLIGKYPDGISVPNVKDAYPNVTEDLDSLKAMGKIRLLPSKSEDIAYPNDDPRAVIKVDSDLCQLFWSIKLPGDMLEIEEELAKNGMEPATNTNKRKALAQLVNVIAPKPETKKRHRGPSSPMLIFQNLSKSSIYPVPDYC